MRLARLTLGWLAIVAATGLAGAALLRSPPARADLTWHQLDVRQYGELTTQRVARYATRSPVGHGIALAHVLASDAPAEVVNATRALPGQPSLGFVMLHRLLGAGDLRAPVIGEVEVAFLDREVVAIRAGGGELLPYDRFVAARSEQARRWVIDALLLASLGALVIAAPHLSWRRRRGGHGNPPATDA